MLTITDLLAGERLDFDGSGLTTALLARNRLWNAVGSLLSCKLVSANRPFPHLIGLPLI